MPYTTLQKLHHIIVHSLTVESADIPEFTPVKFGSDTTKVVACDPNDAAMIGWSHFKAAVGRQCDVLMLGSKMFMRAKVASGQTATAGSYAVGVTGGGYKNAPALSSGTTLSIILGKFLSSGTNGDEVTLLTTFPIPIFTA